MCSQECPCGCREAEVYEFYVPMFVNQDVLGLQVSMANTLPMTITDSLEDFFKVTSSYILR